VCSAGKRFLQTRVALMQRWPILWSVASGLGLLGLAVTFIGLALLAYAAISHVMRSVKKVRWQWHTGVVWISLRLFFGGLILQIVSFLGRLALAA
jgi:hypothetical protein